MADVKIKHRRVVVEQSPFDYPSPAKLDEYEITHDGEKHIVLGIENLVDFLRRRKL